MTMIDDLLDDARERMAKTADSTQNEFASVRTGRATPRACAEAAAKAPGAFLHIRGPQVVLQ